MQAPLDYAQDGAIVTLTLNAPDIRNAISGADVIDALVQACERMNADMSVGAAILTGAGSAFSSGSNVKKMGDGGGLGGGLPAQTRRNYKLGIQRIPLAFERLEVPVIAAVNGPAIGAGCDLACMCDMRIAAESARFSTGYVRVGLVPGDGDTFFLPRLVGPAKALELLWTADFIEAPQAHAMGIVQRVVPDARLQEETYALARHIADGPQVPIRMIKRLVYQSLKLDLRTHLDLVSSHMAIVRQTADHAEGVAAFKEKRPAKFRGV